MERKREREGGRKKEKENKQRQEDKQNKKKEDKQKMTTSPLLEPGPPAKLPYKRTRKAHQISRSFQKDHLPHQNRKESSHNASARQK
jgi:hypothetical protein